MGQAKVLIYILLTGVPPKITGHKSMSPGVYSEESLFW